MLGCAKVEDETAAQNLAKNESEEGVDVLDVGVAGGSRHGVRRSRKFNQLRQPREKSREDGSVENRGEVWPAACFAKRYDGFIRHVSS